ncbi:MAG: two-component regulator propeller domain-containing protein [Candidatus Cryptobacteroides sp.]
MIPFSRAFNIGDYRFHSMPETSYYGGIHSIAKDAAGRIWFSGADAVYMYDGISFHRYNEQINTISPDSYWTYLQLACAADKSVWLATNNGLMRLDYNTMAFERRLDGNISKLVADRDGVLWMLRNDSVESLSVQESFASRSYPFSEGMDMRPISLSLSCACDNVYVYSEGDLYILDKEGGAYDKVVSLEPEGCRIKDVEEYGGLCYVLTEKHGIYAFLSGWGRPLYHYGLPAEYEKSSVAKELYLDPSGVIWAATQSGLMLVDTATGTSHLLRSNIHYPYSLPNNSVWTIYPDPDGGVWVGTYGGKLAYMPVSDSGYNWFKATPGGLSHPIVSTFEEDKDGNIWIGTEGGGINYWDRVNSRFIYYTQENNSGVRSNMIKKLRYDENGRLLMSSFNGGVQYFDIKGNRFADLPGSLKIPEFMVVYDFIKDGNSGYWLSNPDAPLRYLDLKNNRIDNVLLNKGGTNVRPRIETMYRDVYGRLCLVTSGGLYVVDSSGTVLEHHSLQNVPFAKNDLCCCCMASDSTVWFGTRGGGVNIMTAEGQFKAFSDCDGNGLEGKMVFGILEDTSSGNIWMSTNDGLYFYNRSEDLLQRSNMDSHNLCGAYYVRSCFRTRAGEMLFGGTGGFIMFDPRKMGANMQKPKPFLVDLKINSKSVHPSDEDALIPVDISVMASTGEVIRLSHKQSNLEIVFSSDCYLDADKSVYTYRMSGLSDRWNVIPAGQRSVAFYDLPAGRYTFELKAANGDGLWGDEIVALKFKVRPAPFRSVPAIIIYFILLAATAVLVWRFIARRREFKEELGRKDAEIVELYSKKYVAGPSEIVVSSIDDEIMKKALDCIERNMDNNEYSVDDFVADMSMGRTALYQKVNELTGLSVKEFILDIRLKRAAKLLADTDRTVSEISYMTGFVNPKYFSTSFKRHFGMTPTDYKNSEEEKARN